jgi:hypothetical protein
MMDNENPNLKLGKILYLHILIHLTLRILNTLGTEYTNLSFYGSVVVDRRDKFGL